MKSENKRGISLIVLVITIIVIIILAGAVILNLSGNNPIENAKKAQFKSDLDTFKSELLLYKTKVSTNTMGEFDQTGLNADFTNLSYTGKVGIVMGTNIKDIITSITDKYNGKVKIYNGEIVYEGIIEKEKEWAKESGLMLYNSDTNVAMVIADKTVVKAGTNIVYTVKVYSNIGVTDIEGLNEKLTVINENGNTVLDSSKITLGESILTTNGLQKEITINTAGLEEGNYRLKLEADAVSNSRGTKNKETISTGVFTIDSTPPNSPEITLSTNEWANQDITATINSETGAKVEYSFDTITWQIYTSSISISENKIIYARAIDDVGNISGQSSKQITVIDKVMPSVANILDNGNLTLSLSGKDSESGISKIELYEGSSIIKTYTYAAANVNLNNETVSINIPFGSTKIYKIVVTDNAGNTATSSNVTVSNITALSSTSDIVALASAVNSGNTFSGKTIKLANDIDLSSVCSASLGSFNPIGNSSYSFAGTFDGNYHTVNNLYINLSGQVTNVGLFRSITSTGKVCNLKLNNTYVYTACGSIGYLAVGGVVGYSYGTIENCTLSGSFNVNATALSSSTQYPGVYVGGICGCSVNSQVKKCSTNVSITGTTAMVNFREIYAGGVVGNLETATISDCYSTCRLTGTSYQVLLGGVVAGMNTGTMNNCYSYSCTFNATGTNKYVGGITGRRGWSSSTMGTTNNSYCDNSTTYSMYYYSGGQVSTTAGIVSQATLKGYAGTLGSSFIADSTNINNGYPVLKWQVGL